MKRLCLGSHKTKRGVASFYVVIFATILFGVMTLGFMRIILSESSQSSDDDLSRSAYDAAMMGVEDAKTAVNRYYECLRSGGNSTSCKGGVLFDTDCSDNNGIGVAQYLYGNYAGGEVVIQQGVASGEADDGTGQAYTCVIVRDTVPDYRGVLSSDTRTKVIPLAVYDGNTTSNRTINTVKKIRFSWYSRLNEGDKSDLNFTDGNVFRRSASVPPTISLSLIKVPGSISTHAVHNANNANGYIYSTFALLPKNDSSASKNNVIESSSIIRNGNVVSGGSSVEKIPVAINCDTQAEFVCTVDLDASGLGFVTTDSVFLVASLPYDDSTTDFAVTMFKENNEAVDFVGVQVSVDSTGRTSDLVRRVETRLDPADLYFPYPQFEVDLGSGSGEALSKNFWITANCWYSQPRNGGSGSCDNNGSV